MALANAMNPYMSSIMEVMNWPDDAFVPVANEENRQLMEQLQQQIQAKESRAIHLKQLDQRVKLITDHHQNAQADVIQNLVIKYSFTS